MGAQNPFIAPQLAHMLSAHTQVQTTLHARLMLVARATPTAKVERVMYLPKDGGHEMYRARLPRDKV